MQQQLGNNGEGPLAKMQAVEPIVERNLNALYTLYYLV
jgi:hypothetical protein